MTHTRRCPECGRPVGLSSAFLAGLCSQCDDAPSGCETGFAFVAALTFGLAVVGFIYLMAVLS